MRNFFIAVLYLALGATVAAQVTVTGTSPATFATGVSTTTTLSVTFSAPIDTNGRFGPGETLLTNIANVTGTHWSADCRTIYVDATLESGKIYFVLIFSVHPMGGGNLQTPSITYFTTAPSFPSNLNTVSGAITAGTSGISPANAIIGLMPTPFTGNTPQTIVGAVADASGNFIIPYVPPGKWYLIAAKEANGDGQLDPANGDGIAFGDSVTVTGTNITGLVVPLQTFAAPRFMDVRDAVLAAAESSLPANRELRGIFAWDIDSVGRCGDWQFVYSIPGVPTLATLRADQFGVNPDPGQNWYWLSTPKLITNLLLAAPPDSVLARAERMGGAAYRMAPPPVPGAQFRIYVRGGDLTRSEFFWLVPDTTKNYWGACYEWTVQVTQDSSHSVGQKMFLADWQTAQILGVTGVEESRPTGVPQAYSLDQNYPNPFNPSTRISFSLPVRSRVTLEVYNLIGQKVATLLNSERVAGTHSVTWNPVVPSGVYLYRIEAVSSDGPSQRFLQVRKMMYLK